MRSLYVRVMLLIAIAAVSAQTGWLHGGCKRQCYEDSCQHLAAPVGDKNCEWYTDPAGQQDVKICDPGHAWWHMGLGLGTCTQISGSYTKWLCPTCDPECDRVPTVASGCGGASCTFVATYTQIPKCVVPP